MNKKAVSLITALALAASFAGCGKKAEKQEQKAATNVTVSEAKISSIESTVSYTGEVKASSSASVSPKVSGEIKAVYAEIGDFVKAGAVLMKIDTSAYQLSYNQAKAAYNSAVAAYNNVKNGSNAQTQVSMNQNLANAQSAYDTARDNYNRQKSLFDIGAISQVALDAAKTQFDNAAGCVRNRKGERKFKRKRNRTAVRGERKSGRRPGKSGSGPRRIFTCKLHRNSADFRLYFLQERKRRSDGGTGNGSFRH